MFKEGFIYFCKWIQNMWDSLYDADNFFIFT